MPDRVIDRGAMLGAVLYPAFLYVWLGGLARSPDDAVHVQPRSAPVPPRRSATTECGNETRGTAQTNGVRHPHPHGPQSTARQQRPPCMLAAVRVPRDPSWTRLAVTRKPRTPRGPWPSHERGECILLVTGHGPEVTVVPHATSILATRADGHDHRDGMHGGAEHGLHLEPFACAVRQAALRPPARHQTASMPTVVPLG